MLHKNRKKMLLKNIKSIIDTFLFKEAGLLVAREGIKIHFVEHLGKGEASERQTSRKCNKPVSDA